jgi:hypothetical protein
MPKIHRLTKLKQVKTKVNFLIAFYQISKRVATFVRSGACKPSYIIDYKRISSLYDTNRIQKELFLES